MFIPPILYGKYDAVLSSVRKAVTKVVRGATLAEAFGEEILASESIEGLFLLAGPNPLLGGQAHVQFFLPHIVISKAVDSGRLSAKDEELLFLQSLEMKWSLLGLIAQPNVMWVYKKDRHHPFLESVRTFWSEMDAPGARYSVGMTTGSKLLSLPSNLKYVLANTGVQEDELSFLTRPSRKT